MKKTVTRQWKVYGKNGHRQKVSFEPSVVYDWSKNGDVRIVELMNSDKTGTNEYCVVRITRNSSDECADEFVGQLCDGIFENARYGKVEELDNE